MGRSSPLMIDYGGVAVREWGVLGVTVAGRGVPGRMRTRRGECDRLSERKGLRDFLTWRQWQLVTRRQVGLCVDFWRSTRCVR